MGGDGQAGLAPGLIRDRSGATPEAALMLPYAAAILLAVGSELYVVRDTGLSHYGKQSELSWLG